MKRILTPVLLAACLGLTGCGPPGIRALHKGDHLIQSGKYPEAVETLRTATNLLGRDALPVQAKARNLLGLAFQHTGNAARARECYLQALALDRNGAAEANFNLGCLELDLTNWNAAKDAFTTYTSLRPQDGNGFMKLGLANYRLATTKAPATADLRQLGFENARKAFESSQRIQATAAAWNNLALIDLLRRPNPSRDAVSNAVVKLKAALDRDPRYAPALFNLGVVYDPAGPYKYGDVQMAIDAYHKYAALEPAPPLASQVALLITDLDQSRRFNAQFHGQRVEMPSATTSSSNGLTITYKSLPDKRTNVPQRATLPTTGPLPIETPPPSPTPAPTPTPARPSAYQPAPPVSYVPPVANIPPPKPEQLPPARLPTNAPASNPPVAASSVNPSPAASNIAPSATRATAETNVPLASTPARKPSLLARLFGAKSKPGAGAESASVGDVKSARVTPLPAPHAAIHYAAPPVSTNPGNRAEADRLAKQGAAAEKDSRWKDAVDNYEEAVKADPADYEACEALGLASIKAEEYVVALEAFHHALALDSESPNARYGFAWALQKEDFFQDAANELEKLLAHHPDEVRAHLLLGNLYSQKLGQPDFARGHYLKVLEKDPQNPQAPALRAWLKNNPTP
jgi:tetratricopeptide (TPR) repeat protein